MITTKQSITLGTAALSFCLIGFLLLTHTPQEPSASLTTEPLTPTTVSLAEKVGQLFMVGHWADTPLASTTELITKHHLGSVVIMSAPANPAEISTWTDSWQEVSASPLLIAIDQEGGPVSRLRGPDFITTSQRDIATSSVARQVGQTRGQELSALGINLNFAPVLDSATRPDSFMYDRAFPDRADSATLAAALSAGMAEFGVESAVKHFPGHADTPEDSHLLLPEIALGAGELEAFVSPFAELIATQAPFALMTAHVSFPQIDPLPATLSPFFMTTYLRDTLQYDGIIITDDMSMDAIDSTWTSSDASLLAIAAGADIVLFAAEPEKISAAIELVIEASKKDPALAAHITASYNRIIAAKQTLLTTSPQ